MDKAVLSRFIIDRIHKDWIDRLYPQGYRVEKAGRKTSVAVGVGQGREGIYLFPSPPTIVPILKFPNYAN